MAPEPARTRVLPDAEALAGAAADEVAARIGPAVRARGRFSLVLAGGSTPRRAYELLASRPGINWSAVHFFFGDERCVPPDHADSNYAMARRALFDRAAVPEANVHRMPGEKPPAAGADDYERDLRCFFGAGARWPAFDLVLLGMGEDGHTASLFPGNPALAEARRWAVVVETEAKAPRWRVSLSMPSLCAARDVVFLAAGAGKRPVLEAIRRDPAAAAQRFPAAAVRPASSLLWLVDREAAPAE